MTWADLLAWCHSEACALPWNLWSLRLPQNAAPQLMLDELTLSTRLFHVLQRAELLDPARLLQLKAGELADLPGMGLACFRELVQVVGQATSFHSPGPASPSPAPSLEEELAGLLQAIGQPEQRPLVLSLWGWEGSGPKLAKTIADAAGCSRQNIDFLATQAQHRLDLLRRHVIPLPTPMLNRALELLQQQVGQPAEAVEALLQQQKLTQGLFRLEGVLRAAQVLEKPSTLEVVTAKGRRWLLPVLDARVRQQIAPLARGLVQRQGIALLQQLQERVLQRLGVEVAAEVLRAVLGAQESVAWLEAGRFWLATGREGRLLSRLRTILCAVRRVRVQDLRNGLERGWRGKPLAIPSAADLLAICRILSDVAVTGEMIEVGRSWGMDDLSAAERLIALTLQAEGPEVTLERLQECGRQWGISPITLNVKLSFAPFVCRGGPGRYRLLGQPRQSITDRLDRPRESVQIGCLTCRPAANVVAK